MLIDEKRRVHLTLDKYLKQAGGIREQIDSERERRAHEPPFSEEEMRFLSAGIALSLRSSDLAVTRLTGDLGKWQREVYEYLRKDVPGYAEEFNWAVPPLSHATDPLSLLVHFLDVYVDGLTNIKSRQQ